MKLIRRVFIGAVTGSVFWAVTLIVYGTIAGRGVLRLEEIFMFALIGAMFAFVTGVSDYQGILTLRDVQEIIERGEYDTHPTLNKIEAQSDEGFCFSFCTIDGAIFPRNENAICPNSENHPKLLPPKVSNRFFLYIAVISASVAFIYSIVTNEALVTLIITTLLLLISIVVFSALFVALFYISLKYAQPSQAEAKVYQKALSLILSLATALFAMIIVSLLTGQFPNITWWLIEFAIAYALQEFMSERLTQWILSRANPSK